MARPYISEQVKRLVLSRSGGRCEYCKALRRYRPQPFIIEHIIPISKGGSSIPDNLALACGGCNGHKYQKTAALDPITGLEAPLFHPRKDNWHAHFQWDAEFLTVIGRSPIGRATVRTLRLNRPELVRLRSITKQTGEHPPDSNEEV